MKPFQKFHGSGNDFVMIDGREWGSELTTERIAQICNRHLGIGADGLIIIQPVAGYDFEMVYFNSDGSSAKMCGNGARCAVAFAFSCGFCSGTASFLAGDGPHTASLKLTSENEWMVEVSIIDVDLPQVAGARTEIDTGTPHLVILCENPDDIDTLAEGQKIRFSSEYLTNGININWLRVSEDKLRVRTYERGVEAETLSCGTGVTACAVIATMQTGKTDWVVETNGGTLMVTMARDAGTMRNIRLRGPAVRVFAGNLS